MTKKKQITKMRCTVSHEKPLPGGGYATFEAGKEYPIELVPGGSPYFVPMPEEEDVSDDHEER